MYRLNKFTLFIPIWVIIYWNCICLLKFVPGIAMDHQKLKQLSCSIVESYRNHFRIFSPTILSWSKPNSTTSHRISPKSLDIQSESDTLSPAPPLVDPGAFGYINPPQLPNKGPDPSVHFHPLPDIIKCGRTDLVNEYPSAYGETSHLIVFW